MLYSSDLKQLAKKPLLIKDVYPFYRAGGVEMNGKFVFKSFYLWPKLDDKEVYSGDERATKVANEREGEWREKVWDKDAKKMKFVKMEKKSAEEWKEWRGIYKKVLDIMFELEESALLHKWKGEYEDADTLVVQGISASKVKDIIQAVLEIDIPMEEGKLRDGTVGMRPKFDWEDEFLAQLLGKSFSFTVNGTGLDTKYTYKEKPFSKKAQTEDDSFPF